MSQDGAHLGVSAFEAVQKVIGDRDPTTYRDPVEMRAYLESFDIAGEPDSYEKCAGIAGHMILDFLLADPHRAQIPTENVYEVDTNGTYVQPMNVVRWGLYEVMKGEGIDLQRLGLTGFQWGWAVNAARYCVELPPMPNPAIVTIGEDRETV